jgi:hypothetical protein
MSPLHHNIPDDFRGVWQRTLLQTDTDAATPPPSDCSSWVRWLQTSQWHGDLRIPASALLGRQAAPLSALPAARLAALAGQQAFVGITRCEALPEGQVCTWLRRIDFQPPGQQPDAGWMMFDRPDRLIEVGVHDDYNEIWERLPDSTGRYIVLSGRGAQGDDDGRRLLIAGCYMMTARPRQARWPRGMRPGDTLTDVMLRFPEQAPDWLDCDIAFGRLEQGQWHIEHATLPAREGQRVAFTLHRQGEHIALLTLADFSGHWHVLEWSCEDTVIAG